MSASSTITLLQTMEWAKRLNFLRTSGLGTYLEPAKTSANTVLQTILGAPFAWRWNRVVTGFICTAGQQDYTLFNWAAATHVSLAWVLLDANGNCQKVTTAGTTGSSLPTWNVSTSGTTTDGTATWTNLGPLGVSGSSTYSFGWIETASVYDSTPTPAKWIEMMSHICLGLDSTQARPRNIAAQGDTGDGNVTFRLMPIPDKAYPVAITLQSKPVLFTSLNQAWAPIPDEYSHIYNWGFLALMWLFADDPRFGLANQKFVTQLLGASEGLTQTERNIFLGNWEAITGDPVAKGDTLQQGVQSRGT